MDKISESGIITADGKMKLPMERIRAFAASHPGQRIVARFEIVTTGTTEAQLGYYFNYVLPTIRTALFEIGERMTEKQVETYLLNLYPDGAECETARNFSKTQMSDYLEWLKQFAAENLSVYIEEPTLI